MYLSENEGAKFWVSVLSDLKQRGVEDILVACVDGLKGFPEAIEAVYPKTQVQLCIVHQIRSSLKYVPEKDKKAVVADMQPIYKANTQEYGYQNLLEFEEKWGNKYSLAVSGWVDNWTNLSTYFEYNAEMRRAIYTTNAIEAMHRQIRKVTKTKGAFTSDQALLKLIYLAIQNISKKWTMPIRNWGLTMQQLHLKFGDLLFALTNYARHIGINPENALERTNKKFIRRFTYLEEKAALQNLQLQDMTLEEMDVFWNEAKAKGL